MFKGFPKYLVWSLICMLSLTAFGCQPLKQKFTRKKAPKADKFIPILQPIEYEAQSVSPERQYNHYYLIYRVWEKELVKAVEQKESDKRLKEALLQIVTQLEEMDDWVSIDKKQRLGQVLADYRGLEEYFEKSPVMRNPDAFQSKLRKYERVMRKELKTELVFTADQ